MGSGRYNYQNLINIKKWKETLIVSKNFTYYTI